MKTSNEEKLSEMLKEAEGHPLMKTILSDKAAAVFGKRLLTAAKLRAFGEEAEKVVPKLRAEVEALVGELAEYDEGRKAIADKLQAKRAELSKTNIRLDLERNRAQAELLSNCDPRIDAEITFFQNHREMLLRKSIVEQERHGKWNIATDLKEITVYSNQESIKSALSYCLAGIAELDRMKLAVEPDADRIAALRDGIPNADELREYSMNKDLDAYSGASRHPIPIHSAI